MAKINVKAKPKAQAPTNSAPQIKPSKDTMTATELVQTAIFDMNDPLSKRQARDFTDALQANIAAALGDGRAVNLFGLLKIVPRFHTKGEREVYKEFGNPESGKVKKKYPPKVTLKLTALKKLKDSSPTANKMAKKVG